MIGHFISSLPDSPSKLTVDLVLGAFFLAVLANVAYCAAYAVDLFLQFSGLQSALSKGRVAILLVGTAFGGVIAHFFASGMFGPG